MDDIAKLLTLLAVLTMCSACALKDPSPPSSQFGDGKDSGSRNMYSPKIFGDAYAQQQWLAGIEALEKQCRNTDEYCEEAQRARQSLRDSTSGVTRPAR